MKTLLGLTICLFSALIGFSQSQGISYQAIIINQEVKEIPGVDIEGSYLPEKPLSVRFSILNESGNVDYQEIHNTQTDAFGMINLVIGKGIPTAVSPAVFSEIDWDGTPKNLQVDVSIGENTSDFIEFSYQELTFVPYAFHRNITATGDLTVDGQSTFNGEVEFQDITVEGLTNLNGPVNVNNGSPVDLSGELNVTGQTTLQTLTVEDNTTMNNSLVVNSTTGLNGQVTINADVNGSQSSYNSYPLRVEGSNQGVAIRIDGSRNNDNNFITFWDANGVQGRIEGQTTSEVYTEPEYIFDHVIFALKVAAQAANLATAIGASVVDPGNAIIEGVNSVTLAAEIAQYEIFAFSNLGVTYESGSGDYAEWLPRLNAEEAMEFGQVVGVYGGRVTKNTRGAEMVMVVSQSPIVLGNTPPEGEAISDYEKIAFLGQVPVWVMGTVNAGDYILPSGGGNGFAIAKSPDRMKPSDFRHIVGTAWSSSSNTGVKLVNVAIGLNRNDLSRVVLSQQEKIQNLEMELARLHSENERSNQILSKLVPGYKEALKETAPQPANVNTLEQDTNTVKVTREHVEKSLTMIEDAMRSQGIDMEHNLFFSKIHTDAVYKQQLIDQVMDLIANRISFSPER